MVCLAFPPCRRSSSSCRQSASGRSSASVSPASQDSLTAGNGGGSDQTTAALTQWTGGRESNRQLHPSRPLRCPSRAAPWSCRSRGLGKRASRCPCVPLHREEAFRFREAAGQAFPRAPAVLARRRGSAGAGARRRLQRHDVDAVGVVRMDDDRETEIGRQSFGDGVPRLPVVITAQHADVGALASRPLPLAPSSMILHVEAPGSVVVAGDLVRHCPNSG